MRTEEDTICEVLYKLRDAVMAHDINLSVYLSREVHDRLLMVAKLRGSLDCNLQCEIKENINA